MPETIEQLNEKIAKLPSLSKDEILALFKGDLQASDPKKIIGNLKMTILLMNQNAAAKLKQEILLDMNKENQQISGLCEYLQQSIQDEMMAQIPIVHEATRQEEDTQTRTISAGLPVRQIGVLQSRESAFPATDHFDESDVHDIAQFSSAGAKYQADRFEKVISETFARLPKEVSEEIQGDILLKKRFESIVQTYLKDIRDELETQQRMVADRNIGGMGLTHDITDAVLTYLGDIKKESGVLPEKEPIPMTMQQEALAELEVEPILIDEQIFEIDEPKIQETPVMPQNADMQIGDALAENRHTAPVSHLTLDTKKIARLKERGKDQKPRIPQPPARLPHTPPLADQSFSTFPRRGSLERIDDIKAPSYQIPEEQTDDHHLISPADEFGQYGIADLRRAGVPGAFVAEVIRKIDTLALEDYNHRISSIKAWKRSPLYRLYVAIGWQSLAAKKSVDEYLTAQKDAGMLTPEEFDAIAQLNQKLRF